MDSEPREPRRPFLCLLLILLAAGVLYLPVARFYFAGVDDIYFIAQAREAGLSPKQFFRPLNSHVIPVFRAMLGLEYAAFGLRPAGYFTANVALHLAAAALVYLLAARLAESARLGLFAASAFAFSSAHMSPVTMILGSNSSLAALGFLGAAIFYAEHLLRPRLWKLFASLAAQAFAYLSFTYGTETALLHGMLFLALRRRAEAPWPIRRGAAHFAAFALNAALLTAFRIYIVDRTNTTGFADSGSLWPMIQFLPNAIQYLAGGLYQGFGKSWSGASGIVPFIWECSEDGGRGGACAIAAAALFLAGLAAASMAIDWKSAELRRWGPLALCLGAWAAILYFLPILPRAVVGYGRGESSYRIDYETFIHSDRYRYLPGAAMAVGAALCAKFFRPALRAPGAPRAAARGALAAALLFVLASNVIAVRREVAEMGRLTRELGSAAERMTAEMRKRAAEGSPPALVIDEPFQPASRVAWLVLPSTLAQLYLTPGELQRFAFARREALPAGAAGAARLAVQFDGALIPEPQASGGK